MRRGWWPPFGHLGHVPWHFCKAHYGLFSFFSMWLVFDFSMTDRHCYTAKATSPTAGWAAPAPWWPRWPMAACTLDKVWPVLPGQADRHGCASARSGAQRRRRRGSRARPRRWSAGCRCCWTSSSASWSDGARDGGRRSAEVVVSAAPPSLNE